MKDFKRIFIDREPTLICGVGINDANFKTNYRLNNVQHIDPVYSMWVQMIRKCYSLRSNLTNPRFTGSRVHKEFLTFSKFDKWVAENYIDGYIFTPNFLGYGSNYYCPDNCMFVPREIFNRLNNLRRKRELPYGVYKKHRKYDVKICEDNKVIYLGSGYSLSKAENTARNYKYNLLMQDAQKYNEPYKTVYINHINLFALKRFPYN